MVPDLERAGGDANVSEAERVSSERSGGWGRISSLLSPSPAAGRQAGWRGGLRSDPSPPESQAPQQGRVSAVLRPEKKAPWAGAPKEQGNSETQLNPFPQPGKPLLHFPVQPGLPNPRGMNGGQGSCTSARALGGVSRGGHARSLMPQRGQWPEERAGAEQPGPAMATLTFRPIRPLFLWPRAALFPVQRYLLILFLPGSACAERKAG